MQKLIIAVVTLALGWFIFFGGSSNGDGLALNFEFNVAAATSSPGGLCTSTTICPTATTSTSTTATSTPPTSTSTSQTL